MKQIFLILMLCSVVSGTVRSVGTGQAYTTIANAMNAASSPDTIMVYDDSIVMPAKIVYKTGITLMSAPGEFNRIVAQNTSLFNGSGNDNGVVKNIHFVRDPSVTLTAYSYFFEFEYTPDNWSFTNVQFVFLLLFLVLLYLIVNYNHRTYSLRK